MVAKRGRWGAATLLATAMAMAVAMTGCGADSGAGGSASTGGASAKDAPPLPMDRYQPGAGDYRRFKEAQDRLAQRCMVGLGFTDFPRHPKMPGGNGVRLTLVAATTAGPYGRLDLDHARRWGYGWDPRKTARTEPDGRAMTTEEYAVFYGQRPGRKAPKGGCTGQADRRLTKGVKDSARMWTYPTERERRVEKAARKDPRVRRALDTWARCVVDKGFKRYADPEEAFGDEAWGRGQDGNTTRGKRELGTAVADVECKRKHDTVGEWSAVLAGRQRADIARHRATYEAVRRDLATMKANVRSVLGG